MRISVFGLGYVGAISTACLADMGHHVLGVDINPVKLDMIKDGQSPVIEGGLSGLIAEGVQSGRIRVTNDAAFAVWETEVSMICVGTPSQKNGSLDMTAICMVVSQIGTALKNKHTPHLVIVRSTVLPGTVNNILVPLLEDRSGKQVDVDFEVCFNPEFLREGSSIKDFHTPPFTVLGLRCEQTARVVQTIYQQVQAPFLTTTIEAAEMVKYTCNGFHALKIAFANEVGNLCKAMNIDSYEVMKIFCEDTKLNIATAYLKPGFAFGGSCLPKDLQALEYHATSLDQDVPMIRAIRRSNTLQIEKGIQMVLDTGKRNIGLLGLSFKSGTDDLRESPLVTLAERLLGKGLELKIYDDDVLLTKLMGANQQYIEQEIPHLACLMVADIEELFRTTDVIVIGKKTSEFAQSLYKYATSDHMIVDLVRIVNGTASPFANYQGIGW